MKQWISVGLTVCILCLCVGPVAADGMLPTAATPDTGGWLYEVESGEDVNALITADEAPLWESAATVPADAADIRIGGKGAVLMDLDSGAVLYEKESHARIPIASVTKIMTLLLIMEALDVGQITEDTVATCSPEAAAIGGSQIWLEAGETMTVRDLLKAIVVVSANDACAMMAEHLDGSVEAFVARMNRRAAELGMQDTEFHDCSGLDDTAYSSAYDVALMSRALMQYPQIQTYTSIWMDTLRGGTSQLVNTNKLIRFYKGATGLKTGTTSTAGHCLSATAERDGLRLCAVILGCATTDERFGGARTMLDFGFAHYERYTPSVASEQLRPIPVLHGIAAEVRTGVAPFAPLLVKKGQEKQITCEVKLAADVEAPVYLGETVGEVTVSLDGETLATYPVLATDDVPRMTLGTALRRLWAALAW